MKKKARGFEGEISINYSDDIKNILQKNHFLIQFLSQTLVTILKLYIILENVIKEQKNAY
ncbi:hypothetical protein MY04_4308 [Flammeovirga sp. MY04]|uniref:hypothetical protein n=1 Tax=Flammeovirga sp. MY04 TaxID=1191459 RepID=UPI0008063CC3|nr:hypothetical protein [Flammeovirga sp. MY04]ANQ51648.1 hypothetical protein MY04_4308 [Flammeovirga sp. MY04]